MPAASGITLWSRTPLFQAIEQAPILTATMLRRNAPSAYGLSERRSAIKARRRQWENTTMKVFSRIEQRAQQNPRHIVLIEGDDPRVIQGAHKAVLAGAATITVLGD